MTDKIKSEDFIKAFGNTMEWKDMNGNNHVINNNIELSLQQPSCKYLLPCGICTLTSNMHTCSLLKEETKNEKDHLQPLRS